jgi:hypothetical protein
MKICRSWNNQFAYLLKMDFKSHNQLTDDEIDMLPDNTDEVDVEMYDIQEINLKKAILNPNFELEGWVATVQGAQMNDRLMQSELWLSEDLDVMGA